MTANQDHKRATVVLIHGIWMTGFDMSLLRYRLRRLFAEKGDGTPVSIEVP